MTEQKGNTQDPQTPDDQADQAFIQELGKLNSPNDLIPEERRQELGEQFAESNRVYWKAYDELMGEESKLSY